MTYKFGFILFCLDLCPWFISLKHQQLSSNIKQQALRVSAGLGWSTSYNKRFFISLIKLKNGLYLTKYFQLQREGPYQISLSWGRWEPAQIHTQGGGYSSPGTPPGSLLTPSEDLWTQSTSLNHTQKNCKIQSNIKKHKYFPPYCHHSTNLCSILSLLSI